MNPNAAWVLDTLLDLTDAAYDKLLYAADVCWFEVENAVFIVVRRLLPECPSKRHLMRVLALLRRWGLWTDTVSGTPEELTRIYREFLTEEETHCDAVHLVSWPHSKHDATIMAAWVLCGPRAYWVESV